MTDAIFLLSAATCLVSAALLVTRRNPVYAVVLMLPFFLGMTVLFVLLSAPFLAAMQMMVYGGAILVVFLFVIMLINLRPEELKDDYTPWGHYLPAICGGLFGGLLWGFVFRGIDTNSALENAFAQHIGAPLAGTESAAAGAEFGSLANLGPPLFAQFLVPFELVSLLIVVAVLGAVILAKKKL